jgi:hypothetical protein
MALGTIVFDPKLNKYIAFLREHSSDQMFRATSSDGLQWDQTRHEDLTPISMPMDLEPEPGTGGRQGLDLFSCYYNPKDRDHPYQGWLYYANYGHGREATPAMTSTTRQRPGDTDHCGWAASRSITSRAITRTRRQAVHF